VARDGQAGGRGKEGWGLPHRGRISPEEAAWVREHLDEVQQRRSERGVPLLDPADPKTKALQPASPDAGSRRRALAAAAAKAQRSTSYRALPGL